MALLFERSALWRGIVSATRDRRVLVAFTVAAAAGGYAIGKGSQMATAGATEQTKEDMEARLRKDAEAARYASHSKNALAVMFEQVRPPEDGVEDPDAKYKKNPVKLPGVVWHPGIAKKEKEKAMREATAAAAAAAKGKGKEATGMGEAVVVPATARVEPVEPKSVKGAAGKPVSVTTTMQAGNGSAEAR